MVDLGLLNLALLVMLWSPAVPWAQSVDGPEPVPIVAEAAKSLVWSGRVVDGDGQPLSGAEVRVWGPPDGLPAHAAACILLASAPCSEDGAFEVSAPLFGRGTESSLWITAHAAGFGTRTLPWMSEDDDRIDVGDFALARAEPVAQEDVFTPLAFEAALARSADSARPLVVMCTSATNRITPLMLETSWSDPLVREWLRDDGMAIRVDVDEDPEWAASMDIERLPTLVRFEGGIEVARRRSYVPPSSLLAFLRGGPYTFADLVRIFEDEFAHPFTRLSILGLMAKHADADERQAEILERCLWAWGQRDRRLDLVRSMFFGVRLVRFLEQSRDAREAFDDCLQRDVEALRSGSTDGRVWLDAGTLARALGQEAWLAREVRGLVPRDAATVFDKRVCRRLRRLLEEHGDLVAAGRLLLDPVDSAANVFVPLDLKAVWERDRRLGFFNVPYPSYAEWARVSVEIHAEARSPEAARPRLCLKFAQLLAADRHSEARQVAKILLENIDDAESRLALVDAALQADAAWRLADVSGIRPLKRVREQLGDWLGQAQHLTGSGNFGGRQARIRELRDKITRP